MVSKKEEGILTDIEKRTEEMQDRINLLEKPLRILPAWINRNAGNLDNLFATAEQVKSWIKAGFYDEITYHHAVSTMLDFIKSLEKEVDYNRRIFWGEVRDTKRAADILTRIERDELALSASNDNEVREDIIGEISRIKTTEKQWNDIVGAIRLYAFKLREIKDDLNEEISLYERFLKTKNLKELMKNTRIEKLERDVSYIRKIIAPSQGTVQMNMGHIGNAMFTLRSHVSAFRSGAKFVNVRSAAA